LPPRGLTHHHIVNIHQRFAQKGGKPHKTVRQPKGFFTTIGDDRKRTGKGGEPIDQFTPADIRQRLTATTRVPRIVIQQAQQIRRLFPVAVVHQHYVQLCLFHCRQYSPCHRSHPVFHSCSPV